MPNICNLWVSSYITVNTIYYKEIQCESFSVIFFFCAWRESLIKNSTILPLSAFMFLQDYFNTVVNRSQEIYTKALKKSPEWPFSACCFKEWLILETIFFLFACFLANWDLRLRSAKLSTWTDSGITGSAQVSATTVRKNDSRNRTHSKSGHFSAPVLSKIYVSYS